MKKKTIYGIILTVALCVSSAGQFLTPAQTVSATQSDLNSNINRLEEKTEGLQGELSELNSQLVSLLTSIDTLQAEISDTEDAIAGTEVELEYAQAAVEDQYAAMKVRIKYMYETGDSSALEILLESGGISDFLNRVEYVTSVYDYDRQLLDSYTATQFEISEMKTRLESDKETLVAKGSELEAKEASLNALIDSKQGELEGFQEQLDAAKAEAARIAEEERQKALIAAAEEAARREAAAAAALAAQQQQQTAGTDTNSDPGGAGSSGNGYDDSNLPIDDGGANPAPTTGINGSSVVAYAQQFVGNPYVWGGNSLTNGCDCSGFVVQVYSHFGIDLSGSRNSALLRSVGQAVSYSNIQPGDIVCYPGHVALYAGGGVIVEAQSSTAGITCNRSVTSGQILAIRRVI